MRQSAALAPAQSARTFEPVSRRIVSTLVTASLLVVGCGGTTHEEGKPTAASCDPALKYADDIEPLMERYCLRCHAESVPLSQRHGAPGDHNFDTEQGVLSQAEHIDLLAGSGPESTNRSMPPKGYGPYPTLEEREVLAAFLACELDSSHSSHSH